MLTEMQQMRVSLILETRATKNGDVKKYYTLGGPLKYICSQKCCGGKNHSERG